MADENNNGKGLAQQDHDLLIRLDTKMDRAGTDIGQLHTHLTTVHRSLETLAANFDQKIASSVGLKMDREDVLQMKNDADKLHTDHETRIRRLERYAWSAIGVLAVAQIALAFIK